VTDADVALGIVDPDNFLHGAAKLDRDAAETAILTVAEPLGLTVHEAAAGICRIVDSKMADLLRRMSVLRGLDPRAFTCFAYGGMGPVHASAVARNVGMKRLVIPVPHIAPVWSAFGATVADVVHVYQRPQRLVLPVAPATLEAVFGELEQTGRDVLRSEGFTDDRIALRRSLRMRYAAQVFDVEVPLEAGTSLHSDDIGEAFAALYEVLYGEGAGHAAGGIAITALVVRASGLIEPLALAAPPPAADPQSSTRPVYWYEHGEFTDTPVLRLREGGLDERLEGPLLIELPDTVVVVRPGQAARFGDLGTLTIDL
jgi:N-methylhydantoinase A